MYLMASSVKSNRRFSSQLFHEQQQISAARNSQNNGLMNVKYLEIHGTKSNLTRIVLEDLTSAITLRATLKQIK